MKTIEIHENEIAIIGTRIQIINMFLLTIVPSWILVQGIIYIVRIVSGAN